MEFTTTAEASAWAARVMPGEYLFRYSDTAVGNPWPPAGLLAVRAGLAPRNLLLLDDAEGLRVMPRAGHVVLTTGAVVSVEQAIEQIDACGGEILLEGEP